MTGVALWWGALTLSPAAFREAVAGGSAQDVALAVVLIAGASELIGQSVVLFLNGIRPWRFVLALILAAAIFTLEVAIWTLGIWLCAEVTGAGEPDLVTTFTVVALGHAPYVLAFGLLVPYYGPPLQRVLEVWTLLSITVGLSSVTGWPLGWVVGAVAVGFAFRPLARVTVGRWVQGLDRWLWRTATGTRFRLRVEDAVATMRERAAADSQRWFRR